MLSRSVVALLRVFESRVVEMVVEVHVICILSVVIANSSKDIQFERVRSAPFKCLLSTILTNSVTHY